MTNIMLREAPPHWKVVRLGQLFAERREKVSDQDFVPLSVTKSGIVPQLENVAKTDDGTNRKKVCIGDFVINSRSDRRGSSGLSEFEGSVSLISIVLQPREGHPRFLHHLLKSYAFQEEFYRAGHGIVADLWTTRFSEMRGIPVAIPDLPTQKAIADFLARETARIDHLIAKKERLLAILEERESALVSQLVTVGLDPGRPQVPHREGWIAALPVGWSVRRVRDISTSLQTGPFGSQLHSQDYIQDGIPVVNPSHMASGRIVHDPSVSIDVQLWNQLARHALERGDIVFARRGQLGRCALVTETEVGWLCGTGSLRMRPNMNLVVPEYLIQLLSTSGVAQWLKLESVGTTMDNLNTAILGRLPLPIPPLEEQRQVTAYLDAELTQSRRIAGLDKTSIHVLRELRSALITAAVTGQIDVTTWGRQGETDRRLDAIQHDLEAERGGVAG